MGAEPLVFEGDQHLQIDRLYRIRRRSQAAIAIRRQVSAKTLSLTIHHLPRETLQARQIGRIEVVEEEEAGDRDDRKRDRHDGGEPRCPLPARAHRCAMVMLETAPRA
jgi:hypothetical protein